MVDTAPKDIAKSSSAGKERIGVVDMCENFDKLCLALNNMIISLNNAKQALKLLSTAVGKMAIGEKFNNWRKLHGFPMKRRFVKCDQQFFQK